jgi:L-alanine-DL-glutamate epimerase-like enolase superfamily enzyme
MRIERVELRPCVLRKDDPKWRFALGASPKTEGVIVTLVGESGERGYGYGSATPHMGATRKILEEALERFVPLIEGHDSFVIEDTLLMLDRQWPAPNQARAAIDCALHDLHARALDKPLYQLFGQKVRDYVPILRILSIKTPAEMAMKARQLSESGYRYLKIKLEGEVEDDVERVRAIRREVGDGVRLTVDANQSYTVEDAIEALNQMAELDIDLAEQPVAAADHEGLKRVTESVPVTVEADESASSVSRVFELVRERCVDAVSLKIPKLGGLINTLAAARICEAGGVEYRMGAAVGSRLLSAQAMHLAATLPGIAYACELGEFARLLDDPFEGIEIENGRLKLPEGPGSGVSLRDNGSPEATRASRKATPIGS